MVNLIGKAHVNTHGITDLKGRLLGSGLYPGGSTFNHSCAPTCAVSFIKGAIQVHTIEDVKEGECLTIGYVELYAPRPQRRISLQTKKFFECACRRCTEAERIEADRPLSAWICAKCGGLVDENEEKCASCKKLLDLSPDERLSRIATWRRMQDTGVMMMMQCKHEEAKTLFHSILETTKEENLHSHHTIRYEAIKALVEVHSSLQEFEACMTHARQALVCMKAYLPKYHQSIAAMQEHLGDAALQWSKKEGVHAPGADGLLNKSWKAYQRAVSVLCKCYGASHPHISVLNDKLYEAKALAHQSGKQY